MNHLSSLRLAGLLGRQRRADEAWKQTFRSAEERVSENRGAAELRRRRQEMAASAASAARRKGSAESAAALERQRIKEILTSEAAGRSPALARRLAFEGDLSSADAVMLLEAAPDREVVAKTTAKDIIAAAELARSGGVELAPPPKGSLARAIIEAGKKARGESR
jgi:hypothetical protein